MKSFLLTISILISYVGFSQDKNSFYALDANMNATVMDSSKYILWIHQEKDSNWVWDYYRTWGPMIKSNSFADHDGTLLNGSSYQYNTAGNLDSTGSFDHGKKNGSFYKYRMIAKDSSVVFTQYDYVFDSLLKTIHPKQDNETNKIKDSAGMEPSFPGGTEAWNAYVSSALNYPVRAASKKIGGRVIIRFMVDTLGHVRDPFIFKSVEYSTDQEAMSIIKKSPDWMPAAELGDKVRGFRNIPINFNLP